MYTITIIPRLEPRQREARWVQTFEEVPTKEQLQRILRVQIATLNATMSSENAADNLQRVVVCPKALELLEYGDVPTPSTRGTKVHTVFHSSKQLGNISIR